MRTIKSFALPRALLCMALLLPTAVSVAPVFGVESGETSTAAESHDEITTEKGLTIKFNFPLKFNGIQMTQNTYGSADIRGPSYQDTLDFLGPINNKDFWEDSYLMMTYNEDLFGGNFKMNKESISGIGFAKVKGWVKMGPMKFSVGDTIESTYADALGADPGLRIYTGTNAVNNVLDWKPDYTNPDNITQNEGVLLEGSFGNLTAAAAVGDFDAQTILTNAAIKGSNEYGKRLDQSWRFGSRVGYNFDDRGKVNASYYIKEKTIANGYNFKLNSEEIAPVQADAEYYEHNYGVYGTLYTDLGFDFTAGYAGQAASYLTEYYSSAARGMVDTGYPLVLKHGINLNARYTGITGLTLRTDHNLSLWNDKNYKSFNTSSSRLKDFGLDPAATADLYPEVNHMLLWNNIAASYDLSEKYTFELSVRNRFGRYTASGLMNGTDIEYSVVNNSIKGVAGFVYKITPKATLKIELSVENITGVRSQDLNTEDRAGWLIDHVNNDTSQPAPDPVETTDSRLIISVPITLNLTLD